MRTLSFPLQTTHVPVDLAPRTVPGFADITNATWIWGTPGATGNLGIRRVYTSPTGKFAILANCQAGVVNNMTFYLNGLGGITSFPILYLPLNPFSNLFAFAVNATTFNKPGGFIAACQIVFSDGTMDTLVTAADGTWHTAPIAGPTDLAFILPGYFENRTWVGASFIGSYASMPRGPITFQPMPPPVSFGSSFWIWTSEGGSDQFPGEARAFRFTFHPPEGLVPLFATVVVTCDNDYTFFLNGEFVAISPSISASSNDWKVAQRYVLPLQSGPNVFAFVGFNLDVGPSNAGLLVRGQVQLVSSSGGMGGSTLVNFGTDGTWRTLNGQSPPLNFELPSFNDSSWNFATAYAAYGGGVWGNITIPPLT
ncbi:hypothetical protein B0H13DRAFT_1618714 [Mycena leptocephala]|nr:hypothetical protein B0H13DRAFT_1618714 [Mycena leptocephala]